MKLQLVRHATLLLDYSGMKILVDPMLSDAGAMAPSSGPRQGKGALFVLIPE